MLTVVSQNKELYTIVSSDSEGASERNPLYEARTQEQIRFGKENKKKSRRGAYMNGFSLETLPHCPKLAVFLVFATLIH